MDNARAGRLVSLMSQPGWVDVKEMANDQIYESMEWLQEAMVSNPDKLTGKTAISKANRARGVKDLIESIEHAKRIFPQTHESVGQG